MGGRVLRMINKVVPGIIRLYKNSNFSGTIDPKHRSKEMCRYKQSSVETMVISMSLGYPGIFPAMADMILETVAHQPEFVYVSQNECHTKEETLPPQSQPPK